MNASEMCDALLQGGSGETVVLNGDIGEMVEAVRYFERDKIPIKGLVDINQSHLKGNDIRKIDLADANAVSRLFAKFTTDNTERWRYPIIDCEHNGIVATDGWKMLVSRIPQKFPLADAVRCGFSTMAAYPWRDIADELEASEYNLSFYRHMATIRKGSERHGILQSARAIVSAYSFEDNDGYWHTLYMKIGRKFYDATGVADLVDALYELGCTEVTLCEMMHGGRISMYTPLHIYGLGAEVDAKGVIMPIRYADESMGAFQMPIDKSEKRKDVA